MESPTSLFLALDLVGTLAFAVNGALTALRVVRLDIVGAVTLGMFTAMGGGIVRDTLLGVLPPTTFSDWRYLAVAASGGLMAFGFRAGLERVTKSIVVLDAAGLSLFAVTGTLKALSLDAGVAQAVILGVVSAVGGGILRDVLVGQVPIVLRSELYVVPALLAALLVAMGDAFVLRTLPVAFAAALICFAVRMAAVRYRLDVPGRGGDG
ncbi:trimeric intracellular cation channel family protein [Nocardioides bigeumensis]|uniref:Trimeric intracellular cation channel family protein n=1 Tax=Nocardioides bigeumensis TaxID=433657 RepID=A0ABN2YKH1_9ACTN